MIEEFHSPLTVNKNVPIWSTLYVFSRLIDCKAAGTEYIPEGFYVNSLPALE